MEKLSAIKEVASNEISKLKPSCTEVKLNKEILNYIKDGVPADTIEKMTEKDFSEILTSKFIFLFFMASLCNSSIVIDLFVSIKLLFL